MRLFWEITRLSFRRQLTYRAAAWAGLATNLFFGLMRAVVMMALYGARDQVAGMTLQEVVTYTGLTQAAIAYLSLFGWYDVMDSVHSGEISSDLLRPLRYIHFWLAVDLGRAAVNILLRGVSIVLVYAIFVDISLPASPIHWAALGAALALSWLVSFGWRFLVNLAAFWTPNARGVGRFAFGVLSVLSGFYVPLRFFPEWLQAVCQATPFPALVNTPVEIYLGLLDGRALAFALIHQAVWAAALLVLCHLILSQGVRRLVIQGG